MDAAWLTLYASVRLVAKIALRRGDRRYPLRSYVVGLAHQAVLLPTLLALGRVRAVYLSTFAYFLTDLVDTCEPFSLLFWHHVVSCLVIAAAQHIETPAVYAAGADITVALEAGAIGLQLVELAPGLGTRLFRLVWFAGSRVIAAEIGAEVIPAIRSTAIRRTVAACLVTLLAQNARQIFYYARSVLRCRP